jgi:hypothetical protein
VMAVLQQQGNMIGKLEVFVMFIKLLHCSNCSIYLVDYKIFVHMYIQNALRCYMPYTWFHIAEACLYGHLLSIQCQQDVTLVLQSLLILSEQWGLICVRTVYNSFVSCSQHSSSMVYF